MREFIMPFGKHKGEPLTDIPRSYLEWILEQEGGIMDNNDFMDAIEYELAVRDRSYDTY